MQLLAHTGRTHRLAIDGEFAAFAVHANDSRLWQLIQSLAYRDLGAVSGARRRTTPEAKARQAAKNAQQRESRVAYYRNRYNSDAEYRNREKARNNRNQNNNYSKKKARRAARPEEVKAKEREWFRNWMANKRRTDPQYCLGNRLRSRLWHALDGAKKAASTVELIGCSLDHARKHLESKFADGMSWENKHLWHIDHIVPCASFDLSDPEQQKKCFHWTNLQPLWSWDNQSKSDKILTPTMAVT